MLRSISIRSMRRTTTRPSRRRGRRGHRPPATATCPPLMKFASAMIAFGVVDRCSSPSTKEDVGNAPFDLDQIDAKDDNTTKPSKGATRASAPSDGYMSAPDEIRFRDDRVRCGGWLFVSFY